MCGISGDIRFDDTPASLEAINAMCRAQASRGPDDSGVFVQGRLAFGHRRLRIIDTSQRAQQPMFDPQLGLGIVFNGAVYNYPELQQELKAKGYQFYSNGDTEVILKAYHAWGLDFASHLSGMFACAIWERDTGRVVMARDRLGIKPLYYAETAGGLRFASNLTALVAAGGVDTRIDPVALHHYMSFHAVVPAPYTILQGVRKLPPATVMTVEPDGRRQQQTYWELRFERDRLDEQRSFEEWQDLTLESLRTAVRRRLIADVPVGVLLSGGLDSSLIVGLLAEAGQQHLKTYSVGFESVGEEKGDEFMYSDIVAQHYDTDHHKIFVDSRRLLPSLQGAVGAMAEPMVSHDAVGFYLLSEEVSRDVKVVQSGQGADEVFGGYHWYPPMMESTDPVADYARVFMDRDHGEFTRAVNARLVSEDYSRAFVEQMFNRSGADDAVDKALRMDTTIMLVDDPVKRVDNMTMAWGLEARVPFLDHDLVELAARMPARHKVGGGGKYVLKEAGRKVIPHQVIDRPKGYFPVPALKYIRGEYLDFVRGILDNQQARERRLFNRDYLDTLLKEPEAHITPLRGSKLWQAALLELWLQTHSL